MTVRRVAQVKVAKLIAPLDPPRIDEFRDALEHVTLLGEAQPDFIWRARGADFDAVHGPTAFAFDFRTRFPVPADMPQEVPAP